MHQEHEERYDDDAAADAEQSAEETGGDADRDDTHRRIVGGVLPSILEPLAEAPDRSAILLDVDGVLAPIVSRPQDAAVPERTRRVLERLARRYRLVACLSGRSGADAARVVGAQGLVYVGSHGLELDPQAARWTTDLREFAAGVDWPVEDKGLTVSFHFRGVADEDAALSYLEQIAAEARDAGLVPRFGRKVLELRPPLEADKGTAVVHLVERHGIARALYAGDDSTDLDAFRGLSEAGLDRMVRIAVASEEGPEELRELADLVVGGLDELFELLRRL